MFSDQSASVSERTHEAEPFGLITSNFDRPEIDFFEKFSVNVKSPHAHVPAGSIEKQIAQWKARDLVVIVDASHPASSPRLVEGLRLGGFEGGIIVVFGTDKDAEVTVHDYLAAGADEFLRKPMSEGILFVRVTTLLQRKRNVALLETAHSKLSENIALLRHELATPLSVLQMSIVSLKKPDFDSERLESIVSRCERQVAKMLAIMATFQDAKPAARHRDSAA